MKWLRFSGFHWLTHVSGLEYPCLLSLHSALHLPPHPILPVVSICRINISPLMNCFWFMLLWQWSWAVLSLMKCEWDALINTNRGTLWVLYIYQIQHQNMKLQKQLMKTKWMLLAKLMLSSSPSVSSKWSGPMAKIEQAGNTKFHSVEDMKYRLIFQCVKLFNCQWWTVTSIWRPLKNPVSPFSVFLIESQHISHTNKMNLCFGAWPKDTLFVSSSPVWSRIFKATTTAPSQGQSICWPLQSASDEAGIPNQESILVHIFTCWDEIMFLRVVNLVSVPVKLIVSDFQVSAIFHWFVPLGSVLM